MENPFSTWPDDDREYIGAQDDRDHQRGELLKRSFLNKASRLYSLEQEKASARAEEFSETKFARRYVEILKNSLLVIFDEQGMYAWKFDKLYTMYDTENNPRGFNINGAVVGEYKEEEFKESNVTVLNKTFPKPVNALLNIEEISDSEEREVFSSLLNVLGEGYIN